MKGNDEKILTIHICVGSSCYVRGSDQVAARLEQLIEQAGLADAIEVVGAFCMEQCYMGVTIRIGDAVLNGITVDDTPRLFSEEVLPRLRAASGASHVGR
ncbi:MAG: (2Fe-2S) ferredoxin domain-containing protein [Anaerolineae bacterium]